MRGDEVLREDELVWLRRRDRDLRSVKVLPVAIFDRECWWRDAALSGLEAAGRHYRIAFTSESTVGVRAAVSAGIAAGLLSAGDDKAELVPLPDMDFRRESFLVLRHRQGATGNIFQAMCEAIRGAF